MAVEGFTIIFDWLFGIGTGTGTGRPWEDFDPPSTWETANVNWEDAV